VIAGERAEEPVRELAAQDRLEPLAPSRPRVGAPREACAVVEQAADGFPVGRRRCGHDTVDIDLARSGCDPWRE